MLRPPAPHGRRILMWREQRSWLLAKMRCQRVLPELWDPKPGIVSDLFEVWVQSEGSSGPEVQGDDAHDWATWSGGSAPTTERSAGSAASGRNSGRKCSEQTEGHDGWRRAADVRWWRSCAWAFGSAAPTPIWGRAASG